MTNWYRTCWLFLALYVVFSVCVFINGCSHSPSMKEKFQAELDSIHAEYRFPGATAAYMLPDGTVEVFAVGLSDIELEIPMTTKSRMLAASIGKTFVGATVLALSQEGRLNLDDPVSKWIKDLTWFSRIPNHESMTIRQLLNHTSGIPNHVEEEEFLKSFREKCLTSSNISPPETMIKFILDKSPLFQPGEGWYYTDTGYLLLGLIIEQVTGDDYYEEVTCRFLNPLNLELTTPSNMLKLFGLASGYMAEENPFGLAPKTTISPGVMAWHPGIEWTGGGFVSNPGDLVVWGKALFEGRAIKGNYLDDLLKSVPISEGDSLIQYGTAVAIYRGGTFGTVYGHGGWIPGYSSSLRYYPEYDICIAFQINTDIGIVDHSTPLIEDMEKRLAEIVLTRNRK